MLLLLPMLVVVEIAGAVDVFLVILITGAMAVSRRGGEDATIGGDLGDVDAVETIGADGDTSTGGVYLSCCCCCRPCGIGCSVVVPGHADSTGVGLA